MKPSLMWAGAVVAWLVGLFLAVIPEAAQAASVSVGDINFNLAFVVMFFAVGLAWGDLRSSHRDSVRRIERIEKHLFDE